MKEKISKTELKMAIKNSNIQREALEILGISKKYFRKLCKVYEVETNFDKHFYRRTNRTKLCKYCKKQFFTRRQKQILCSNECSKQYQLTEEYKEKLSKINKGQIPWNKGTAYYNAINKTCPVCNNKFDVNKCDKDKIYCSRECYLNDSEHKYRKYAKGGYRKGSGRGKSGWYKGYWCDSTYELCYLIYCLDHDIKIERNKEGFKYEYKNKIHTYYPDFLVEGDLVEIKGYNSEEFKAKRSAVTKPLKVLFKKDLKDIFDYVNKNYTNNYVSLYDGYKPKYTYTCSFCGKKFTTDKERKVKNKLCSRSCSGKFVKTI